MLYEVITGIYLRQMSTGQIRYVEGSDIAGPREIKFSPDGTRLAFTVGYNGGVFTVVVPSGLPERQTEEGRLSYWESDNSIIFVDDAPGGRSYRKRIGGGDPEIVALTDESLTSDYGDIPKTFVPGSSIAFGHQLIRNST